MPELFLTFLDEPIPSKKNSKNIVFNKKLGRSMLLSSNKFLKWNERNLLNIKKQYSGPVIKKCDGIILGIRFYDNRKRDLTNSAEGLMDLLVKNKHDKSEWEGVLVDDCHQVTGPVTLKPMNYGLSYAKINYESEKELHESFSV